ncbi:nuclear transport factor 2 family protein [Pseudonocardia spinosispora]|uniref:nuclear transport factor 2 family protein n=1 Tax=Pseudonocardia spinosispora TaxID=103441 RepID=UPI0004262F53|nr:nuclear transport factor 2 family protein [Pseudonocardia spinosispora]
MTVEELLEIEQIRALRDRYAAAFDSCDVAGFAELFCDDAVCEFPEEFGGSRVGRDTIAAHFAEQAERMSEPRDAVHVTTNPWITLTGPDTAHGRCYLLDLRAQQHAEADRAVSADGNPLLFLGMCEDDYRKVDGRWKFATIRLPFFWADQASEKSR